MSRLDHWAPIIGGLAVYVVYRLFYIEANIYYVDPGLAVSELSIAQEATLATLRPVLGRLGWSLTGIFFILAFFSAVIVLGRIIHAQLGVIKKAASRYAIVALTVVVAASVAGLSAGDNAFTVNSFNPILEKTFSLFDMPQAGTLANTFTPMVLIVTVLLMAAASITLKEELSSDRSPESCLRDQFRHLNTALFIGATMLVAGIVHASATHRLPATLLDQIRADELDRLVDGLSANMGAVWTLMLLGIYLPAIAVLRIRATRLAQESVSDATPKDIDDWLSNQGLTAQFSQKLAHVAALLSPLIIGGPAAPFLKLLTG